MIETAQNRLGLMHPGGPVVQFGWVDRICISYELPGTILGLMIPIHSFEAASDPLTLNNTHTHTHTNYYDFKYDVKYD